MPRDALVHARCAPPIESSLVGRRCRLAESRTELHAMLDRAPFSDDSGARLPLLVFLNKADRPGAISPADATAALRLDDLGGRRCHVQLCSAREGGGIGDGLRWLAAEL